MVIDITGKSLTDIGVSANDSFLLDTNILMWLFSGYHINVSDAQKVNAYSAFVAQLISSNVKLWTSTGNIQEMFHLIEKNEYELFKIRTHRQLKKKDYRKLASERAIVKNKGQSIYAAITAVCKVYRLVITD